MNEALTVQTSRSLQGNVMVPGDKSISHRAVMFAALAEGKSQINNWLPAADCWATVRAMQALGATVEVLVQAETGAMLSVTGVGLRGLRAPRTPIDCYGSGTTMRLLAGILAGQKFAATLDGHSGLRKRPMERIAHPLRLMGAEVNTTEGRPPMHIHGGQLKAIDYTLPMASAQVKSAVLLAGLYADGETTVREPGPTRDHTERMLRAQGVLLAAEAGVVRLLPPDRPLTPFDLAVPADISSAAFMLVAALLVPNSRLTLLQVNTNPTRTGLLDVLQEMGADFRSSAEREQSGEPVADFTAQTSALRAVDIGGETVVRMIDEFPILAVAATQAEGVTRVREASELRVKETDRIAAVVEELSKMGAKLTPHPDGFDVHGPTSLQGTTVDSRGDHRLAMALTIAGLIAKGETRIQHTDVIGDSYPGFVNTLQQLGAEVQL